jgi:MGT family glycosyltransferase
MAAMMPVMARILAYTSPARGHLFPIVGVLDELRARGHEVAVRTLASQIELMRSRGFAAAPIDPGIEALEHSDYGKRSSVAALRASTATFVQRAQLEVGDLRRAIGDEAPDALLVDVQTWGGLAAAEAWGGPWASWCPYPLPLPSRDAPPFGPGLRPARGPLGRLRDRALAPLVLGTLTRTIRPPIEALREGLGLERLERPADFLVRAPLLLYMTAAPFEYPRSDWPPSIRMVGPCAWEPPAEAPPWLAGVERPIVLVTTSSEFQDDGRLVAAALEALAGEDVEVVATVPSQDPSAFRAPANARVERFLPHGPVLDRAACAVTHGGMGATQKALARGVPVCAVPFGRDQLEVARRVEVAQAGTRLSAGRLSAGRLRRAVLAAMGCTAGARRVADGFAAAGGPVAAAGAVEELLGGPA